MVNSAKDAAKRKHTRITRHASESSLVPTLRHASRIPDSAACFPWSDGNISNLESGFDEATGSTGEVLVSRTGDMDAISAYGYTYIFDFVGSAVRGDMDVRLLIAQEAADDETYANGVVEVVFEGLGEESSVDARLDSNLDNATFTDAIVEFT